MRFDEWLLLRVGVRIMLRRGIESERRRATVGSASRSEKEEREDDGECGDEERREVEARLELRWCC